MGKRNLFVHLIYWFPYKNDTFFVIISMPAFLNDFLLFFVCQCTALTHRQWTAVFVLCVQSTRAFLSNFLVITFRRCVKLLTDLVVSTHSDTSEKNLHLTCQSLYRSFLFYSFFTHSFFLFSFSQSIYRLCLMQINLFKNFDQILKLAH